MMQMKLRGAMTTRLMACGLLTFLAVGTAAAQPQSMRVEVPYEFRVGSKVMPAGSYSFALPGDNPGWLEVRPEKGQALRAHIVTRLGGPTEFQNGTLVFEKSDAARILSEVWIPGTDGVLVHSAPKGRAHETLMSSAAMPSGNLTGKAAFDRTCRRCHGPDGTGEPKADKFFGTTIPRLNSAAVQSKSDEELKEIITSGRREMPPVEINEVGFNHKLAPQLVDSVIAYVRTLKQ